MTERIKIDKTEREFCRCGACGSEEGFATQIPGVYSCARCGGINGETHRANARFFVKLGAWHENQNVPAEDWSYVDLTLIGNRGIERVHGWVHSTSREWLQVG